jgi:hypothetical protein
VKKASNGATTYSTNTAAIMMTSTRQRTHRAVGLAHLAHDGVQLLFHAVSHGLIVSCGRE